MDLYIAIYIYIIYYYLYPPRNNTHKECQGQPYLANYLYANSKSLKLIKLHVFDLFRYIKVHGVTNILILTISSTQPVESIKPKLNAPAQ